MPRLRTAAATALLLAFPLFSLGMVALLVWVVRRWYETDGGAAIPWQLAAMVVASLVVAIGFAVRDVVRLTPAPTPGPELTRDGHPALWAEVDSLADHLTVPTPTRAVLVPGATAAVAGHGGTHELLLGLPVLATFTLPELRSVLAHELGHIAGGDPTAAARLLRWRALIVTAYERSRFPASLVLGLYTRLAHAAAAAADRDVEARADAFSAAVAGPAVAAGALRHLVAVDAAWDVVVEDLLPLCSPAGVRAPAVDALEQLLAGAHEKVEDAVREALADRRVDWTSSHPPVGVRVAAFEAMPGGAADPGDGVPAHALITGGRARLVELEAELLSEDLQLAADWDEVVRRGMGTEVLRRARDLTAALARAGATPDATYAAALDFAARHPEAYSGEDDDGDLAVIATAALIEAGALRFTLDWADGFHTVDPDGRELDVVELAHPVWAEGEDSEDGEDADDAAAAAAVARIRALLDDRGVDLDRVPGQDRDLTDRRLGAVLAHVRVRGVGRTHALVYGDGLLLLPARTARLEWWFGQKQLGERGRLEQLAVEPVADLRATPGARWLTPAEVTRFRFAGAAKAPVMTLGDGTDLRLSLTTDTEGIEEAYPALARLFAAVAD